MNNFVILLLLISTLPFKLANADIFKMIDTDGRVYYTDLPEGTYWYRYNKIIRTQLFNNQIKSLSGKSYTKEIETYNKSVNDLYDIGYKMIYLPDGKLTSDDLNNQFYQLKPLLKQSNIKDINGIIGKQDKIITDLWKMTGKIVNVKDQSINK